MIVFSALGAVGGGGAIIFFLSSWLGKVWANRILEADRSKYAAELEGIKLANQNAVNSLSLAHTAYLESKKGFTERRLKTIDTIWEEIIFIRDNKPSPINFLDILVFSEYQNFATNPKFSYVENETKLEKITILNRNQVDLVLPYLDDRSYQIYWAYRALAGRLTFYINKFFSNEIPDYDWRDDSGVQQILKSTLSDVEVDEFRDGKWGAQRLFQYLEVLLSRHLKKLASGTELASEALEDSIQFSKRVSDIRKGEMQEKANQNLQNDAATPRI